jgi:hypothetical protein
MGERMENSPNAKRLRAIRWERKMTDGGSEAHLLTTDGGSHVVKARNNPQGVMVLANELIGALCLDWLGVQHPQPAIVDVPQSLIDANPSMVFSNGTAWMASHSFGSEYWQSDPQGAVAPELIVNLNDVAGTVALDTWLKQHDSRQYRVRSAAEIPGKYDFIPVDQGHCIGNPDWRPETLQASSPPAAASTPVPGIRLLHIRSFIARLRQFEQQVARHVSSQVPDEWLKDPVADKAALETYLVQRAPRAADVLDASYAS